MIESKFINYKCLHMQSQLRILYTSQGVHLKRSRYMYITSHFNLRILVYLVIYDSGSVPDSSIFSPRETSPHRKPYGQPTLSLSRCETSYNLLFRASWYTPSLEVKKIEQRQTFTGIALHMGVFPGRGLPCVQDGTCVRNTRLR